VTQLGSRVAATTISLTLLIGAPVALAAIPVPEDFSAADQYVESVPTSSGPKPARKDRVEHAKTNVPVTSIPVPSPVKDLDGTLKKVATSPTLGAPERSLPDAKADTPKVPAATVSAIDDADGGRLLWLLLALVLVSGATVGAASYRHRARRKTASG
jgi:hypothetical protein